MPKPPRLDLRRLERDVADTVPRSIGLAPGGRPATGLITGIMSSVRRQAKRRAAKTAIRQGRPDLPEPVPERGPDRRLGLSADLVSPTPSPDLAASDAARTEEAIRRESLDKLQDLLKPAILKKD